MVLRENELESYRMVRDAQKGPTFKFVLVEDVERDQLGPENSHQIGKVHARLKLEAF